MNQEILPTEKEVWQWLLDTTTHVFHIEYYLMRLQVGNDDPERPHDIIGVGNKFSWPAVKGYALQYRNPDKEFFDRYIFPSLEFHRQQYHHQQFNEPNPRATAEACKLGAVDVICALLENRAYQGGAYTFEQIKKMLPNQPNHKIPWLREILPEMQQIERPSLEQITSLTELTNIGIQTEMYDLLQTRLQETLKMLADKGYNIAGYTKIR